MILYICLLTALAAAPQPPPAAWLAVIGEYGEAAHPSYVLEKDGKLFELADSQYRQITLAEAQAIRASRKLTTPQTSATFRVKPLRPVADLRREALAATPPHEAGDFRPSDLVEPAKLDANIRLDIRYATTNNFLSTPVYSEARARLQRPAAEALLRVSQAIRADGFGLLIHDAWRPWYVTKIFWDAVPDEDHKFVADPKQGSRHNRGCAVDLTIYDLKTRRPIEMTGSYDEMSDRSYPNYPGGTTRQRWHRDYLRHAMEKEGFTVNESEWWHFDYKDWSHYRIADSDPMSHYPLQIGHRWVYDTVSKSGNPNHPEVSRWTATVTVREHLDTPHGLVIVRGTELQGAPNPRDGVQLTNVSLLLSGTCVYPLYEDAWKRPGLGEYLKQVSPVFCFPLQTVAHWDGSGDWTWTVDGAGPLYRKGPQEIPRNATRLKSDQSGTTAYIWFMDGTGPVASWSWHNGSYTETTEILRSSQ